MAQGFLEAAAVPSLTASWRLSISALHLSQNMRPQTLYHSLVFICRDTQSTMSDVLTDITVGRLVSVLLSCHCNLHRPHPSLQLAVAVTTQDWTQSSLCITGSCYVLTAVLNVS